MASTTCTPRSVVVTGANGYLGFAIARAFSRAGWRTYGLIRRASSAPALHAAEIVPIIGSSAAPYDVLNAVGEHTNNLNAIVSATEQLAEYRSHFEDNIRLFRLLAQRSLENGVRPLMIFTSGCKDYGRTGYHGSTGLAPHTEQTKLDPPLSLVDRATASEEVLVTNLDVMDTVTTRPTLLWGGTASFSGFLFDMAEKAARGEREGKSSGIYVGVDKNIIYHACHVDDVGDAYVTIADADRSLVKGKVYNISSQKYETTEDVILALVKEYGIRGKISWDDDPGWDLAPFLGYSQWVSSERIRGELGWTDNRLSFVQNLKVYRKAFEAARDAGDERVSRMAAKTKRVYQPSK